VSSLTIAKGTPWGYIGGAVDLARVATTDTEVVAMAMADPGLPIGLTGGALWASLGGESVTGRLFTDAAMHLPIDLLAVELGDGVVPGVVHRAAGTVHASTRTRRPLAVIGNIGAWGPYRALPRAHPNDGLADAIWGDLSWRDLWIVRSRAVTGTHLPHPSITERRASTVEVTLSRTANWFVDGRSIGRAATATITVEPDAATVVV
jgi:hypothetical protein